MNLEELLQEAKDGNMVAQYDLAEQFGKRLKETDREDEIKEYSRQAVYWLKQSARQGYGPAVEAVRELNIQMGDTEQLLEEMAAQAQAREAAPIEEEREPVEKVKDRDVSGDTRVMKPIGFRDEEERGVLQDERARSDSVSRTNVLLAIMLGVSLLLNIFLVVFMFRILKNTDQKTEQPSLSSQMPAESASAAPADQPSPSTRPTLTPDPTATPTPTPTPTVEPTEEPGFWLDLSKYPDLEVVPAEDAIYDDYVYYSVSVSTALNMRSGPGTSYTQLGTIPDSTKIGAVSKQGSWYLVYYDGKFGWVSSAYLTTNLS